MHDAQTTKLDVIQLTQKPACRIVWMQDSLKLTGLLDIEAPLRKLDQTQAEAVVFLGKVGVGISAAHLQAGCFEQYDGIFLVLDEEDHFDGTVTRIPEMICVSMRFRGSHMESPAQYRKLMAYIQQHQFEAVGFSQEITMIDSGLTNDPEKFVTEISIPVKNF